MGNTCGKSINTPDQGLQRFPTKAWEKKVTSVDLHDNPLGQVPVKLWKCRRIKNLNLGNTGQTSLDKKVGNMANLKNLGLNDNQIGQVPEEL